MTRYQPIFCSIAAAFAKKGCTRHEIAEGLQIRRETLWRWEQAYPEFAAALIVPIELADARVERSLYERAVGYTFESEKIFCTKDGEIRRAATLEHVPPDTTAQIFWLKNRKPAVWRDKREYDLGDDVIWVTHDPTKRPPGYTRKRLPAPTNGHGNGSAA